MIDQILEETEHSNLTYQSAKGERGGVLATLSEIGESLKLLPPPKECSREIRLTDWAKRRRGWIFITSSPDTQRRSQKTPHGMAEHSDETTSGRRKGQGASVLGGGR